MAYSVRLDGSGNLEPSVDFRSLYATVLERWWGMDSRSVLAGRFAPLDLIKA
ncbi:twin-arginine translocation pathway signal sequence domain-containing protein [Ralstonia solanacearum]|nr:twin-arginine translocation pathway signal sequence domain-containing protein [Ralstonia solanacearum]